MDLKDECTEPEPVVEVKEVNNVTLAATTHTNAYLPGTTGVYINITGVNVTNQAIQEVASHQAAVDILVIVEDAKEEEEEEDDAALVVCVF